MKGDKRERILRILLDTPDGSLTAYRIHKKADCSEQWTGLYLKKLEKKGLIQKTKVTNIQSLFDHWLAIRRPMQYIEYHLKKEPLSLVTKSKLLYALTTYKADSLIHQYLFPTRTDLYILQEEVNLWYKTLKPYGLIGPGNVRLIIADPHIITTSIKKNAYILVSKPQLICDLFLEGGVAVDAAHLLIRKWYSEFI